MGEEPEKKKKDRPEVPLTRDAVIKRKNKQNEKFDKESPLATLQEIFEETTDKDRFIGDTMFWKYFEDIDVDRVKDTKSVEYLNLRFMFFETLFYLVLLSTFTAYAFLMQNTSVYFAREDQMNYWRGCNLETGVCRINQVRDVNTFWNWMYSDFVPNAFYNYGSTPNPRVANISTDFAGAPDFGITWSPRFVGANRANLLIGAIRIRELRVMKNEGCDVSKLYNHIWPDCFPKYSTSVESKDDYRPRFVPTYLMDAYTWKDKEDTLQTTTEGQTSSYPGSGFMIDLPVNKTESQTMISDLRKWFWEDRSTRAIIIELNTLNTNVNVIVNSRILFEFGATGSMTPVHKCNAAQAFFFTPSTKAGPAGRVFILFVFCAVAFGIQTVWCLFLMYKTCMNFLGGAHSLQRAVAHSYKLFRKRPAKTTLKGLKLFFRTGYHFLRYEWNMMDFLILFLWYWHIAFRVYTYGLKAWYENLNVEKIGHPELFMPFSAVMEPITSALQLVAVISILIWVKAFKYLCMLGPFRLLVRILEKCAKELIIFAFVLLFIFFGFAVCFFIAYGSTDQNFSTISGSFLVLFFLLMDGYKVDPWWFSPGKLQIMPIVFFCYITLIYFVLLNVFLAIVLDVYAFTNHIFVIQSEKYKGKENPMVVFLKTYIAWCKGISLIRNDHDENLKSEDLNIDLERLPGLVRRKWIEKKRLMQRIADANFAGLTLFPEDEDMLFEKGATGGSDWMLPNSRLDMTRMINAKPSMPLPVYEVPQGMLKQTISRAQLQRLMDEDNSLPLLLNEKRAVEVIRKFQEKRGDEDEDDEFAEKGENAFMKTQAEVFHRLDDLERVPPDMELPKVPDIIHMTEDMSHALSEVQNQFRVQLTGIIEATATLFEHLVELTQGLDAVRNNHEEVLTLVRENQADEYEGSSARTGSQR